MHNQNQQIAIEEIYQPHEIIPTGVAVRVDCNPIARYVYATRIFELPENKIPDIDLIQV